jgi:hypothetical protein
MRYCFIAASSLYTIVLAAQLHQSICIMIIYITALTSVQHIIAAVYFVHETEAQHPSRRPDAHDAAMAPTYGMKAKLKLL